MMPIHTNSGLCLRFIHVSSRVESGEMIESPYFVGSIPSFVVRGLVSNESFFPFDTIQDDGGSWAMCNGS